MATDLGRLLKLKNKSQYQTLDVAGADAVKVGFQASAQVLNERVTTDDHARGSSWLAPATLT